MDNPLKSLFSPTSQGTSNQVPNSSLNPDAKNQGETYQQYGTRMCAKTFGSEQSLVQFIRQIFTTEKNKQIQDQSLQNKSKAKLQGQLDNLNLQIESEKDKLSAITQQEEREKTKIEEIKEEISKLKIGDATLNREAHLKLVIGCVLGGLLTIYLFVFYSSTFYSAFFKDFTSETNIGDAMFDAQALSHAWNTGFTELLFILLAPIIFLCLGFVLHFFWAEKTRSGTLKGIGLLMLTGIIDCVLAYLIAAHMHQVQAMMSLDGSEEFTMSMAVSDVNVWAVIMCGFVVYVIWGLVFDMTWTAFEDTKSNKHQISALGKKIAQIEANVNNLRQQEVPIKNNISTLEQQYNSIKAQMNSSVIDLAAIKQDLNNFFAAWQALLPGLNKTSADQTSANNIYSQQISALFPSQSNS